MPERTGRAAPVLIGILLLGATLAVLLSALSWEFLDLQADETVIAWAGKQIANGRVPYRDFFEFLPPFVLYGAGWIAEIFGPGLVPLRIATLLVVCATTMVLYQLLVERAVTPIWSAMTAFCFPALLFCIWPLSSHYWFAIGFLASAAWICSRPDFGRLGGSAAGFLFGLAGLCVQTAGVFFLVLTTCLFLLRWRPQRRVLIAGGAGLAVPLGGFCVLLFAHGALDDAFRHVILWPLTTYATAGGVNDVELFGVLNAPATWLTQTVPDGDVIAVLVMLLLWVTVLGASAVALAGLLRHDPTRWQAADMSIVIASILAFIIGRHDWTHLAVWSVPVLFVMGTLAGPSGDHRLRVLSRSAAVIGFLFISARFAMLWSSTPPSPRAVLMADANHLEEFNRELLSQMPGVVEHNLPVFYLSWAGSMLYLVWAPIAPPLDWLHPPSMRLNVSADYETAARFIEQHHVPYLAVAWRDHDAYFVDVSAMRTLLVHEFEYFKGTSMGAVYVRRGFLHSLALNR